ncbi:autotransporter outer membrane beta-barrel domain-containing protein [Dickeya poaceiphila]|nr:autotransporter domain-containing protein [Dickeya poaceiphila]
MSAIKKIANIFQFIKKTTYCFRRSIFFATHQGNNNKKSILLINKIKNSMITISWMSWVTSRLLPLFTVLFLYTLPVQAAMFNNAVVFGDSLSDAGNLSQALGLGVSRFTTNPGENTAMYVADGLGLSVTASSSGGTDFAWGGAGILNNYSLGILFSSTIQSQVNSYLQNNHASASTLYQMWGGSNDIYAIYESAPTTATAEIIPVAQEEVSLLNSLYHAGGKYVVVYNLPNLGATPDGISHHLEKKYQDVVSQYNQTLNNGLDTLSKDGLNIIPVNTYKIMAEIMANPSAYGIINTTRGACDTLSSLICSTGDYAKGTENTYLFADNVHPTTGGYKMLASVVLSEMAAPGKISLLSQGPLAATKSQYNLLRNEILADTRGNETRVFLGGDYRHASSTDNTLSTNGNNRFISVGGDVKLSENFNVGAVVTQSNQTANISDAGYKLYDSSIALYEVYHIDNAWLSTFFNAGRSNFNDVYRTIHIGPANRQESGSVNGHHLGGGIDGGWWFSLGPVKTGPFARLERQFVKVYRYSEHGDDSSAMWFSAQRRNSLVSGIGWRAQGQWSVFGLETIPFVEIARNHDYMANTPQITAGLNSMSGYFSMPGADSEKNWNSVDAGMTMNITTNLHTWVQYSSQFDGNNIKKGNYGVSAGLEYAFR